MAYFLKKDMVALEAHIRDTIKKLKETGTELRTAVTQSSETWHDNFGFENAQQQARLLGQRLDDLERIKRNATVIDDPTSAQTVAIGHTVTVRDSATGKEHTWRIGSQIAFAKDAISYASPIGALLLGKQVGQQAKGTIGTKERTFEILAIR